MTYRLVLKLFPEPSKQKNIFWRTFEKWKRKKKAANLFSTLLGSPCSFCLTLQAAYRDVPDDKPSLLYTSIHLCSVRYIKSCDANGQRSLHRAMSNGLFELGKDGHGCFLVRKTDACLRAPAVPGALVHAVTHGDGRSGRSLLHSSASIAPSLVNPLTDSPLMRHPHRAMYQRHLLLPWLQMAFYFQTSWHNEMQREREREQRGRHVRMISCDVKPWYEAESGPLSRASQAPSRAASVHHPHY